VRGQREVVEALRDRSRRRLGAQLHRARDQAAHLRAQVRTLSPQSTLDRGYAIVQHADGAVVSDPAELEVGELLRVRVARGDFGVRTVGAD
jgi:exodeoxyribonuclease VII large subunit